MVRKVNHIYNFLLLSNPKVNHVAKKMHKNDYNINKTERNFAIAGIERDATANN